MGMRCCGRCRCWRSPSGVLCARDGGRSAAADQCARGVDGDDGACLRRRPWVECRTIDGGGSAEPLRGLGCGKAGAASNGGVDCCAARDARLVDDVPSVDGGGAVHNGRSAERHAPTFSAAWMRPSKRRRRRVSRRRSSLRSMRSARPIFNVCVPRRATRHCATS